MQLQNDCIDTLCDIAARQQETVEIWRLWTPSKTRYMRVTSVGRFPMSADEVCESINKMGRNFEQRFIKGDKFEIMIKRPVCEPEPEEDVCDPEATGERLEIPQETNAPTQRWFFTVYGEGNLLDIYREPYVSMRVSPLGDTYYISASDEDEALAIFHSVTNGLTNVSHLVKEIPCSTQLYYNYKFGANGCEVTPNRHFAKFLG
jgi:hypothetical protein